MDPRTWHAERARTRVLTCVGECTFPVAVVHLSGYLDLSGVPTVRSAVLDCLAVEPDLVAIEVAGLSAAADGCITVFPTLAREATTWPGSTLAFARASPAMMAAAGRAGADLACCPTVAAARDIVESWPPRLRIRHPLPASPVAAPVARRLLDRACEAWEVTDLIEPAELVITELVANAVRYAANGVLLTISLRQGQLQISVSDDSPARPRPGVAGRSDEHGRGLALVEAVSIDWGTACISDGKVVWAKVAAPSR